jgi:hypothetical protein
MTIAGHKFNHNTFAFTNEDALKQNPRGEKVRLRNSGCYDAGKNKDCGK